MTFQLTTRRAALFAAAALTAALYLADLAGMGLVSTDEPRYADIGRAMASSGDWITPRLWGQPWFEKPPLLYWLIGLGFRAGLGTELAPRLPVALLSLGFLAFFWFHVRSLWDERVATFATVILSTSAGWLALSHVAVTDVPMAALFTAAVLFAMAQRNTAAAAALGFAVLAKSLVPVVLFAPVAAVGYRRWREWLKPAPVLVFLAIAVPWHVLAFVRNGYEFVRVLFVQQQVGRFISPERQHAQQWWYYLPVFLLFLYPWFPLLPFAARNWRDRRTMTLLAVVLFGLIFFSGSLNKLATYVLPLLPATCILIGIGLARTPRHAVAPILAISSSVVLLGALPFAAAVVPAAVAVGLSGAPRPWNELAFGFPVAAAAGILLVPLFRIGTTRVAWGSAFGLAGLAFLWFQFAAFPALDRAASARPMWRRQHPECAPELDRSVLYGLYYYSGGALPGCAVLDRTHARVVR